MSLTGETKRDSSECPLEALCWTHVYLESQATFHAAAARFKGFSGPVGSGKSAALCLEALRRCYLNPGRQGVLGAPTLAMLRDATLTSLSTTLDNHDVEYEIRKADGQLTLIGSGSTMLLRSLDEPERLRGTNLAWFGIDELSYSREEAWLRLEARLRDPQALSLCGFGAWTPQGQDWLYRRFLQKPIAGYECVRAKPFENRFVLERTPDYYARLESSYDPKFYQQEVLGQYINSQADRVYHCFDPAIHIVQHNYDPCKKLLWALDFNVAPMSSVVLQWDQNRLVVIDEIVLDRATTEEACQEFENRYTGHIAGIDVFGDANGRTMHTTGLSDYSILQNSLYKAGFRNVSIRVPRGNPAVLSRVQRVNAMLTNALGEVRLELDARCKELVKDFQEVLFKPETGIIDKARDPLRTHASDALGYAIWELFGPKPHPVGERGKRLF